ncbi:MAG: YgcG family protein [Zoogloeaceae bacterium]|nr:YgcG family protein [Zoogloeaceae bacterium]
MRTFAALLLAFWVALAGAQELQPIPALKARVTDLTGTLSAEQQARLEGRLAAFEQQKGAQLAVLLVPTTQPEVIEQYSIRVVEQWQLGRKGVDDGVLLLVAKQDRKLRIEVGYGLEGALNDATARRIIAEIITPRFKAGDFAGGIEAGVESIVAVIDGEPLPAAEGNETSGRSSFNLDDSLFFGIMAVAVLTGILRTLLGRVIAASLVAGVVGVVVFLATSSLIFAAIAGVVAFIFALLGGGAGGGGSGGGGSWSSSSGGSSWSDSGSGGFSGGGGSFGGGGSSGSW